MKITNGIRCGELVAKPNTDGIPKMYTPFWIVSECRWATSILAFDGQQMTVDNILVGIKLTTSEGFLTNYREWQEFKPFERAAADGLLKVKLWLDRKYLYQLEDKQEGLYLTYPDGSKTIFN